MSSVETNIVPTSKKRSRRRQWLIMTTGTAAATAITIAAGLAVSLYSVGNQPNVSPPKQYEVQIFLSGFITQAYAYSIVAPSHFNAIQMTSPMTGWGAGYDKNGHFQLIKTTDRGVSWNKVILPTSPPTYDISTNQIGQSGYVKSYFLNGSTGWLSWIDEKTQKMTVMQTNDGGKQWTVSHKNVSMYAVTVSNIYFVNKSDGWILATSSVGSGQESKFLFSTNDGGKSWSEVANSNPPNGELPYEGTYTDILFSNNGAGWFATGDPASSSVNLLQTTNGGGNWSKVSVPVPSAFTTKSNPVSATAPIIQGQKGTFTVGFSKLENDGADHNYIVIYGTTNGGQSWTPTVVWSPQGVSPNAMFMGIQRGWIVAQGKVYQTVDSGKHWSLISSLSTTDLRVYPTVSNVKFVNADTGWILLQSSDFLHSKLLKTIDGGHSWSAQ